MADNVRDTTGSPHDINQILEELNDKFSGTGAVIIDGGTPASNGVDE